VSDGLVNGSSDWKDLAEWSDEIKQNRLLPSKLPLEYRAKDLSDLLFKLLEKDPWKRPSRVGELFFLDFFASESWLRDFEEIEAELMRIPSQQVESMVEGKFSAQKFLNFTDQERNKWRQNLCIPAALQLDHSVEGMESEVNALIDCCDCAKSQAQALRELEMDDEHDHSRLTFELAEKLENFHRECRSSSPPVFFYHQHKTDPPENIKKLYEEIQAFRQEMSDKGFWFYGCNPPHKLPAKISAPEWSPKTIAPYFNQPICERCRDLRLDWTSIAHDLHYILHERTSQKEFHNGIRDHDHIDMDLDSFLKLGLQKGYRNLTRAEVASIRFYTSHSFVSINSHLRKNDHRKKETNFGPHPFPSIVENIVNGLQSLRNDAGADARPLAADDSLAVGSPKVFWRGLSNVSIKDNFTKGTENAFMSTTSDFKVALQYAIKSAKPDNILFRIESPDSHQCGADIQWLSMFPAESEFLYPPYTSLKLLTNIPVRKLKKDNMMFRILTVQPSINVTMTTT
jgi:hypothetical protein